jgi:hypothetical protein
MIITGSAALQGGVSPKLSIHHTLRVIREVVALYTCTLIYGLTMADLDTDKRLNWDAVAVQ